MERQHFAYLIIAAMVLLLIAGAIYARHNSRERVIRRRRHREDADYADRIAAARARRDDD